MASAHGGVDRRLCWAWRRFHIAHRKKYYPLATLKQCPVTSQYNEFRRRSHESHDLYAYICCRIQSAVIQYANPHPSLDIT
eukprot:6214356-Pleurochrysis_carterae.AAC.1